MRTYVPMNIRGMKSLRDNQTELQKVQNYLKEVESAFRLIPGINKNPVPGPIPPGIVPPPLTDFFYKPGLPGGQIGHGDTNASGILVISSTRHVTKGKIYFGAARGSAFDDFNNRFGIKTSSPAASLHVKGESPSVQIVTTNGDRSISGGATWVNSDGTGATLWDYINDQPTEQGPVLGYINVTGSGVSDFDLTAITDPGAAFDNQWVAKIDYTVSVGVAPTNVSLCNAAGVGYGAAFASPATPAVVAGVRNTYTYTSDGTAAAAIRAAGDFGGVCLKLSRGAGVPIIIYDVWLEIPTGGVGPGSGGKTIIAQAASSQVESLQEWQTVGGTSLLTVTVAGRLTVETGGSMRFVPGAGANRVLYSTNASGDLALAAISGDVTFAAGVITIANNAVTYAKMQDISAASRLLGRGSAAGAGDPQEITLGTGLSMSGTTLNGTAVPPDGDYGDISIAGGVWNIDANAVGTTEIADSAVTAAKIADRTRVENLPIDTFTQSNGTAMTFGFVGTYPNRYKRWNFVTAPAAQPQGIYRMWQVPQDYVSGGRVILEYTSQNTTPDDNTWEARVRYFVVADVAEDDIANQVGLTGVATNITKVSTQMGLNTFPTPRAIQGAQAMARLDIGADMTGLSAGKWVRLHIERNSNSANDTYADSIDLVGVYVTYTADS